MEEESSIAICRQWWQTHPEDALLTPLEIQAADIVIARQGIRHEVAVRYSPGRVPLPGIHDQAVAQFVGHVSEGVVATTFTKIDRNIGDKSILCELNKIWSKKTQYSIEIVFAQQRKKKREKNVIKCCKKI